MATKALQMDDEGMVSDEQTRKTQKSYESYEKEQSDAQRKLEERDKRMLEGARKVKEKIKSVMPFKKGGSASSRADGCAVRGKTKGKML
jgi:hypothetical protein